MSDKSVPTITLITDFGLQDGHVGAMKGVIHSIAPKSALVDISHYVPPQNIRWAGFVLMTAYLFWPANTVHLIVVDPGVGTDRRAVAMQTAKGTFVAPDNGVLSYVLVKETVTAVVALTNEQYWHHPVSPVFHGRDIFGPAAAHLANGVPLLRLGEPISPDSLIAFSVPEPVRHFDRHVTAHIQHVDRFGNCISDLPGHWLLESPQWRIDVGGRTLDSVRQTFGDVPEGDLVALVDSSGFMAVAVRNGNAAQKLGLEIGDPIILRPVSREVLMI